ncbi:uncharacterized protein LOC132697595 isoform X3 [Cylas formicarius]|uniref:uncharacterized protein LOC132697583 isoform X3 n=1 Tax=Cylas formicarius TaxID=197179 RepID=UPI0029584432|nr:uncharacterized protein LOC132697583 isoform X3 [Cylas formicarius]XP_060519122.1 uncharacterized protein LOC132697585 isoform X3 [Cylas formicarius]XP_060519126.1 uncharacterized protein LOC132697586 isoform X3 [Cylas formicarius]XP_060519134.1 uncharacterized protein LOC132697595 isoform X3 [Cylas formicarius]
MKITMDTTWKCQCIKIYKRKAPEENTKKINKLVSKSCACRRDFHEKILKGISEVQPHTSSKCKCKIHFNRRMVKEKTGKSKFVSKSCTCRRDVHEKRFGGISEVQPHTSHKGKCKINFNWRMVKENTGKDKFVGRKCVCRRERKGLQSNVMCFKYNLIFA